MKTESYAAIALPEATMTQPVPKEKVCMHLLGPASTNYRVMNDATALVEAGFEVSIVDVVGDRTLPREEEMRGISLKHIIMPGWFVSTHFKPWFLVKALLMIIYGIVRLLRVEADIYHAHVELAVPASYIAAKLRRVPLIIDTPELTLSIPGIMRWPGLRALAIRLLRYIVPRCAGYITGSPLYAQEIMDLYHAPKVTVVRHVPPLRLVAKSDRLHRRLGLDPQVRIALYQGYLQADRGLDKLVRAAPFLAPDIVIVMMGNGYGSTQGQLRTLIASEKVADRVKILPAVPYEELLDWTASADIGLTLLPPDYSLSIRKCLPNKFFEYLMAGLPILSSPLDAIVEMIKAHGVGEVVTSLAPEDIAKAINTMLADEATLARMRLNALNVSRRDFYWEKESQKLIRLYAEVLGTKKESATQKPLKVCMHIVRAARGDVRALRAARTLAEAGFEVSILDIESERQRPVKENRGGVQVKHILIPGWLASKSFEPWFFFNAVKAFVLSIPLLIRAQADIYHANEVTALPACYIVAKLRRKPLIYEAYELPLFDVPLSETGFLRRCFRKLIGSLLALMLPGCAGVVTVSPPIAVEIKKRYRLSKVSLIRNIPPYQAVAKSDRLRRHLSLSPNVRIALYQGNLQPGRGLEKLAQAAAFLEEDIVIVMMGKGMGNTQSQLESLIKRQGLDERVKILPPVAYEELLDWTASADLGLAIYPLDYTLNVKMCLPNKFFEYLMAGLPVLSSPLEPITELIRTYDVGQVVSSLAPADIGAAINAMLADPAALAHLSRNALAAAKNELCWEKESQQLIRLYKDIK